MGARRGAGGLGPPLMGDGGGALPLLMAAIKADTGILLPVSELGLSKMEMNPLRMAESPTFGP